MYFLIASLSCCYTTHGLYNKNIRESEIFEIINVDDEGDGDFISMQTAIDAANPGDIIRVYSGTYNENIEIIKKTSL